MPTVTQNPAASSTVLTDLYIALDDTALVSAGASTLTLTAASVNFTTTGAAFTTADQGKVILVGTGAAAQYVTIATITGANAGTLTRPAGASVAAAAYSIGWWAIWTTLKRISTSGVNGTSYSWINEETGYKIPSTATQPVIGGTVQPRRSGDILLSQGIGAGGDPIVVQAGGATGAGTVAVDALGNVTGTGTAFATTDIGKIFLSGTYSSRIATAPSATSLTLVTPPPAPIVAGAVYDISTVGTFTLPHVRANFVTLVVSDGSPSVAMEAASNTNHPHTSDRITPSGQSFTLNGFEIGVASYRPTGLGEIATASVNYGFIVR